MKKKSFLKLYTKKEIALIWQTKNMIFQKYGLKNRHLILRIRKFI